MFSRSIDKPRLKNRLGCRFFAAWRRLLYVQRGTDREWEAL